MNDDYGRYMSDKARNKVCLSCSAMAVDNGDWCDACSMGNANTWVCPDCGGPFSPGSIHCVACFRRSMEGEGELKASPDGPSSFALDVVDLRADASPETPFFTRVLNDQGELVAPQSTDKEIQGDYERRMTETTGEDDEALCPRCVPFVQGMAQCARCGHGRQVDDDEDDDGPTPREACAGCSNDREVDSSWCMPCKSTMQARVRDHVADVPPGPSGPTPDQGLCMHCKGPTVPGAVYCQQHIAPSIDEDGSADAFRGCWDEAAAAVHANSNNKGWWDEPRHNGTHIALMHSELSEALEAMRKGNPPSTKAKGFSCLEEELADVVIRIMDYAVGRGLDVAGAIEAKHEHNKTRPQKHGKEF